VISVLSQFVEFQYVSHPVHMYTNSVWHFVPQFYCQLCSHVKIVIIKMKRLAILRKVRRNLIHIPCFQYNQSYVPKKSSVRSENIVIIFSDYIKIYFGRSLRFLSPVAVHAGHILI